MRKKIRDFIPLKSIGIPNGMGRKALKRKGKDMI
jgi:hypothetical protein